MPSIGQWQAPNTENLIVALYPQKMKPSPIYQDSTEEKIRPQPSRLGYPDYLKVIPFAPRHYIGYSRVLRPMTVGLREYKNIQSTLRSHKIS
jgi:hypothetical protein